MEHRKMAACTAATIAFIIVVIGFQLDRPTPTFDSVQQACARLRAAGYHCRSDCQSNAIGIGGVIVSRVPLAWEDVNDMRKTKSRWSGRVWLCVSTQSVALMFASDELTPRTWGKVLAFGDEALLDEIEQAIGNPALPHLTSN